MADRALPCALAGALALTACSHAGTVSGSQGSALAREGAVAPAWSEPSIPGPNLSSESLRGKALYLNFFASWCPPCNSEAPAIDALARAYRARGLQVVGVDVLENARKAGEFRQRHALSYPVVVDDGTLRDRYEINGLPVHVFVDRSGVVRKIVVGQLAPQAMRADIERVLR